MKKVDGDGCNKEGVPCDTSDLPLADSGKKSDASTTNVLPARSAELGLLGESRLERREPLLSRRSRKNREKEEWRKIREQDDKGEKEKKRDDDEAKNMEKESNRKKDSDDDDWATEEASTTTSTSSSTDDEGSEEGFFDPKRLEFGDVVRIRGAICNHLPPSICPLPPIQIPLDDVNSSKTAKKKQKKGGKRMDQETEQQKRVKKEEEERQRKQEVQKKKKEDAKKALDASSPLLLFAGVVMKHDSDHEYEEDDVVPDRPLIWFVLPFVGVSSAIRITYEDLKIVDRAIDISSTVITRKDVDPKLSITTRRNVFVDSNGGNKVVMEDEGLVVGANVTLQCIRVESIFAFFLRSSLLSIQQFMLSGATNHFNLNEYDTVPSYLAMLSRLLYHPETVRSDFCKSEVDYREKQKMLKKMLKKKKEGGTIGSTGKKGGRIKVTRRDHNNNNNNNHSNNNNSYSMKDGVVEEEYSPLHEVYDIPDDVRNEEDVDSENEDLIGVERYLEEYSGL